MFRMLRMCTPWPLPPIAAPPLAPTPIRLDWMRFQSLSFEISMPVSRAPITLPRMRVWLLCTL